jgi:hypothetical protein
VVTNDMNFSSQRKADLDLTAPEGPRRPISHNLMEILR